MWYNDHLHNVLLERKDHSVGSAWKQRERIGHSVAQKQIRGLLWCTVNSVNVELVLSVGTVWGETLRLAGGGGGCFHDAVSC